VQRLPENFSVLNHRHRASRTLTTPVEGDEIVHSQ